MTNNDNLQLDDHDLDGYQIPTGWHWASPEVNLDKDES